MLPALELIGGQGAGQCESRAKRRERRTRQERSVAKETGREATAIARGRRRFRLARALPAAPAPTFDSDRLSGTRTGSSRYRAALRLSLAWAEVRPGCCPRHD